MKFGFLRQNIAFLAKHPSHRRPLKRRRLFFDCLEDRRVLSASALTAAGAEFAVSGPGIFSPSTTQTTSSPRSVATDNAGNAAAVWMSPDANGDGNVTLNYQYYANGSGGLTPTFAGSVAAGVVPSSVGSDIGFPPVIQVAMAPGLANTPGEFVVIWETSAETARGTTTFATHAQVFNPASSNPAAGATAPFVVGSGSNMAVSVAMNNNGFDVLYDVVSSKGFSLTATVQQFNSAGQTLASPVSVTPISYGTGSISMDANSNFVVVWDTYTGAYANPGNYFYIDAQRYNSAGQAQGSVIQVNSPNVTQWPNIQIGSAVSMDPATGDFVVAWQQRVPNPITQGGSNVSELLARQFTANGTPVEANSVITVATATFDTVNWLNSPYTLAAYPSGGMGVNGSIGVAALPGGAGAFDLTWTNYYQTLTPSSTTPSGWQGVIHQNIYAKSYDSSGAQTQWLGVTKDDSSDGSSAAVDANGDLLVLWSDAGQIDGQLYHETSPSAGGFVVSAPANAVAGGSFNVTITATNPDGSINANYNGTVYLASSAASVGPDPSQQGLPASITLVNGSASFQLALETAGLQTLTATSADGSVSASAIVDVGPAAAARFAVSTPASDQAGASFTFTVIALDAYGNVVTGYNGPIYLTSSDGAALLPSGATLVNGVGTFTATFNTTGNQTITVTDSTGSISGKSQAINVYAPAMTGKKR